MTEILTHGRWTRRRVLAITMAAVGSDAVARGASAEGEPDVEDILNKASMRLAEIESLHFTLDVQGETYIEESGTIQLLSAEGDLARPDKVAVEFRVSLLGTADVSIRMITVGDESWTTDLITGNWGDAPPEFGYNPAILYDNQDGLGPVMGKLQDPQLTGTENFDDREVFHITGSATAEVIGPLTADTMTGDEVALEIWIDTGSFDLRQVRVVESASVDKEESATWDLKLSEFNQKVTIEPPV